MEPRKQVEQIGIPSVAPTFGNSIWIHRHWTWIATRFGLYRNKRRETPLRGKWDKTQHRTEFASCDKLQLYDLKELPDTDAMDRFFALLDEQSAIYEVV